MLSGATEIKLQIV